MRARVEVLKRPVLGLVMASLVSVLTAPASVAQDWPSWRGRGQNGVSDVTGLPVQLVAGWREPDLVGQLGRALDPVRVRWSCLCERTLGRRRRRERSRRLLERRGRDEALGTQLHGHQHHGPLQPGGVGQRRWRPGDWPFVRDGCRRPLQCLRPGRNDRVELAARRGVGSGIGLRRSNVDARGRRRQRVSVDHRCVVGRLRGPASS